MHKLIHEIRRFAFVISALLIGVAGLFAFWPSGFAAADQVQSRSITMGDADVNATNVSYKISFDISSSYATNMKSYIVDFCSESPLVGDSCTAPAGLDMSAATATAGNTAGWTIATTASQIKASDAAGIAGGSTVTLEMGGITNPSSLGAFYARIYTYNDNAFGTYVDTSNPGNFVDYGGVAMTTSTAVDVSAFVQEEITFCISDAPMGLSCVGADSPNITVGHGVPPIVDGSQVDTGNAYMQTSTNAQSGAQVRVKSSNDCGGLSNDGGATCPVPPAGNSAIAFNAGTADFGMNVAPGTGGIGAMNPTAPYNQSVNNKYAMDMDPNLGVTGTYGSKIADSGTGCSNVNNTLTFAAAASNITAAGTYNTTLTLIATGTF
jgi:hypothetical protein